MVSVDDPEVMGRKDRALGAIMGAFVGDAAGGPLEFFRRKITDEDVSKALRFPGGGALNLQPGQITDDSEMAMCILHALNESEDTLDLDLIAKYFMKWTHSDPIDMGITTQNALSAINFSNPLASDAISAAKRCNRPSLSNGGLMRLTPLAVWCHRLPLDQIAEAAKAQTALTHSNPTAQHASAIYCLVVVHLINHPDDREGAYQLAKSYAVDNDQLLEGWFSEIEGNVFPPFDRQIGFLKIALMYGLHYLRVGSKLNYRGVLEAVLVEGGDTDTNAAIIGGIFGALEGLAVLPEDFVGPVLDYRCFGGSGKAGRPEFLIPGLHWPEKFERLFDSAPTELKIKGLA